MISYFCVGFILILQYANCQLPKQYQDNVLNLHNGYRRLQRAADMKQMYWSPELASEAQAWVSQCMYDFQYGMYGENMYYFESGLRDGTLIERAIDAWYNERYKWKMSGDCTDACSYTQMVWARTTQIGCAINRCPELTLPEEYVPNGWFIYCLYDIKGNTFGELPFQTGEPCSICDAGEVCRDKLCADAARPESKPKPSNATKTTSQNTTSLGTLGKDIFLKQQQQLMSQQQILNQQLLNLQAMRQQLMTQQQQQKEQLNPLLANQQQEQQESINQFLLTQQQQMAQHLMRQQQAMARSLLTKQKFKPSSVTIVKKPKLDFSFVKRVSWSRGMDLMTTTTTTMKPPPSTTNLMKQIQLKLRDDRAETIKKYTMPKQNTKQYISFLKPGAPRSQFFSFKKRGPVWKTTTIKTTTTKMTTTTPAPKSLELKKPAMQDIMKSADQNKDGSNGPSIHVFGEKPRKLVFSMKQYNSGEGRNLKFSFGGAPKPTASDVQEPVNDIQRDVARKNNRLLVIPKEEARPTILSLDNKLLSEDQEPLLSPAKYASLDFIAGNTNGFTSGNILGKSFLIPGMHTKYLNIPDRITKASEIQEQTKVPLPPNSTPPLPPSCEDKNKYCKHWKVYCNRNSYVFENCRSTCKSCDVPSPPSADSGGQIASTANNIIPKRKIQNQSSPVRPNPFMQARMANNVNKSPVQNRMMNNRNTIRKNTMMKNTINPMFQKSIMKNRIPQNSLMNNGNRMYQNGMMKNNMPMNGMAKNNMPMNGMMKNNMPMNGMMKNNMPMNGMMKNNMAMNGLMKNNMPMNGMMKNNMAMNGLMKNNMPMNGMMKNNMAMNGMMKNMNPSMQNSGMKNLMQQNTMMQQRYNSMQPTNTNMMTKMNNVMPFNGPMANNLLPLQFNKNSNLMNGIKKEITTARFSFRGHTAAPVVITTPSYQHNHHKKASKKKEGGGKGEAAAPSKKQEKPPQTAAPEIEIEPTAPPTTTTTVKPTTAAPSPAPNAHLNAYGHYQMYPYNGYVPHGYQPPPYQAQTHPPPHGYQAPAAGPAYNYQPYPTQYPPYGNPYPNVPYGPQTPVHHQNGNPGVTPSSNFNNYASSPASTWHQLPHQPIPPQQHNMGHQQPVPMQPMHPPYQVPHPAPPEQNQPNHQPAPVPNPHPQPHPQINPHQPMPHPGPHPYEHQAHQPPIPAQPPQQPPMHMQFHPIEPQTNAPYQQPNQTHPEYQVNAQQMPNPQPFAPAAQPFGQHPPQNHVPFTPMEHHMPIQQHHDPAFQQFAPQQHQNPVQYQPMPNQPAPTSAPIQPPQNHNGHNAQTHGIFQINEQPMPDLQQKQQQLPQQPQPQQSPQLPQLNHQMQQQPQPAFAPIEQPMPTFMPQFANFQQNQPTGQQPVQPDPQQTFNQQLFPALDFSSNLAFQTLAPEQQMPFIGPLNSQKQQSQTQPQNQQQINYQPSFQLTSTVPPLSEFNLTMSSFTVIPNQPCFDTDPKCIEWTQWCGIDEYVDTACRKMCKHCR